MVKIVSVIQVLQEGAVLSEQVYDPIPIYIWQQFTYMNIYTQIED